MEDRGGFEEFAVATVARFKQAGGREAVEEHHAEAGDLLGVRLLVVAGSGEASDRFERGRRGGCAPIRRGEEIEDHAVTHAAVVRMQGVEVEVAERAQ